MKENAIKEISNKEELETTINDTIDKYVVVDFWAEWCGPCKMLKPILNEIALEDSNIQVVAINVDNNTELSNEYGIKSIPAVYIYKNGVEITKFIGVKSKSDIIKMLE